MLCDIKLTKKFDASVNIIASFTLITSLTLSSRQVYEDT